jgi:hypothetical protein
MLSTDQEVSIGLINNAIKYLKQLQPIKNHSHLAMYAKEWVDILERIKTEIVKDSIAKELRDRGFYL